MSTSRRRPPRPKVPKTKTFAGLAEINAFPGKSCWTCRRRKVKCDNTRPKCQRCARDYQCEGYDIELFWLGERCDEPGPSHVRHKAMVVRDDALPRFCLLGELSDMIERLDQAECRTENVRVGPFSIFSLKREIRRTDSPVAENVECSIHGSDNSSLVESMDSEGSFLDNDVEFIDREPLPLSLRKKSTSLNFGLSSVIYNDKTVGFLMHNYISNIADLLQPVHHSHNPYKSIYIPNALIGSSNLLLGMGNPKSSLSYSNVAIFHALLSVSAFHLRGTGYTQNEMLFEKLGYFHRAQAQQNLRMALEAESGATASHEAMAAMLSLVTSDLMEGSMTEFWIHLDGCNRLRTSICSNSAPELRQKQLQTVCLFMTTLTKSTDPDMELLPWPFDDDTNIDPSTYLSSPFDATDFSLEFVYGITATLASYMYLVIRLSQHTLYYKSLRLPLPPSLVVACDSLGTKIAGWCLADELLLSVNLISDSFTTKLIRHHALAFYAAIRIFFHTRLSNSLPSPLPHYTLAIHSQDTLSNLIQMEEIKIQHAVGGKAMAPIVWPGFVAACEAADGDRNEWRAWWTSVQRYRIGSIATMWTVVQEVWAERERGFEGVALWIDVCRRKGQRVISGG